MNGWLELMNKISLYVLICFIVLPLNLFSQHKVEIKLVDSVYTFKWIEKGNNFNIPFYKLTELSELSGSPFKRTKIVSGNGYMFQIMSIPIPEELASISNQDTLMFKYIDMETLHLGTTMGHPELYSFISQINLPDATENSLRYYLWGFNYPSDLIKSDSLTEEIKTSYPKKSIFICTVYNKYITGISYTLFELEMEPVMTDYIIQALLSTKFWN